MKRYILLLLILLELSLIKIPTYVELNNLAIITDIAVIEENNRYTLLLKETIPIKDDQGINYKYKYYKKTAKSLDNAYTNLQKSTSKKLYLNKVKSLTTNIPISSSILNSLKIKPSEIVHTTIAKIKENFKVNQY